MQLFFSFAATSALDSTTEKAVQQSFKDLSANRTTLVIAHRLTTIQDADLIIVMKEGRLIEQGTFNELIAMGPGGSFFELWQSRQIAEEGPATTGNGNNGDAKPEEKKEERKEKLGGHGSGSGGHGHGGGHGR